MTKISRLALAATVGIALGWGMIPVHGDGTDQVDITGPVPRFTIATNTNCVVDNRTGLMWARDASLPGAIQSWAQAVAFCKALDYGGYTDWRLPSFNELVSLIDSRYSRPSLSNTAGTGKWAPNDPFRNVVEFSKESPAAHGICYYWASTTTAGEPGGAWLISMFYQAGTICPDSQASGLGYVWPVRGGQ